MKDFTTKGYLTSQRPAAPAPHIAYKEGKEAYLAGKQLKANPYKFAGVAFEMWAEGWRDAEFADNGGDDD